MNRLLLKAITDSKITDEVIAAVQAVAADRSVATPAVLIAFVGYVEPTTAPSNTARNTAILAMLSHYLLTLE
jgi:hypothetical protein